MRPQPEVHHHRHTRTNCFQDLDLAAKSQVEFASKLTSAAAPHALYLACASPSCIAVEEYTKKLASSSGCLSNPTVPC